MYFKCKCSNSGGPGRFYLAEKNGRVGVRCADCDRWVRNLISSEVAQFEKEYKQIHGTITSSPRSVDKTSSTTTAAIKVSSNSSEVVAIDKRRIAAFGITRNGDIFIDAAGHRYNVTRSTVFRGKSNQESYNLLYRMITNSASGTVLQFELSSDSNGSSSSTSTDISPKDPLPPRAELTEENMTINDDELPW